MFCVSAQITLINTGMTGLVANVPTSAVSRQYLRNIIKGILDLLQKIMGQIYSSTHGSPTLAGDRTSNVVSPLATETFIRTVQRSRPSLLIRDRNEQEPTVSPQQRPQYQVEFYCSSWCEYLHCMLNNLSMHVDPDVQQVETLDYDHQRH